jgi:hypothetical protein
VLKFDDNDVVGERFRGVESAVAEVEAVVVETETFDGSGNCVGVEIDGEVVDGDGNGSESGGKTVKDGGVEIGGEGRGISKISTTSECPLLKLYPIPPPKNILFVDDVDARQQRDSERVLQ